MKKTEIEATEIFRRVSSMENLLFYIANARQENSDEDYDGPALRDLSKEHVKDDIENLRNAANCFRVNKIIPNKP